MMRTIKDLKSKTSSMESDGVYIMPFNPRSEERRVGKECRSWCWFFDRSTGVNASLLF